MLIFFHRLTELESEKKVWTDGLLNNPNLRKGTALFALLLVVSLNLGPLRFKTDFNFTIHQLHLFELKTNK